MAGVNATDPHQCLKDTDIPLAGVHQSFTYSLAHTPEPPVRDDPWLHRRGSSTACDPARCPASHQGTPPPVGGGHSWCSRTIAASVVQVAGGLPGIPPGTNAVGSHPLSMLHGSIAMVEKILVLSSCGARNMLSILNSANQIVLYVIILKVDNEISLFYKKKIPC